MVFSVSLENCIRLYKIMFLENFGDTENRIEITNNVKTISWQKELI